MKSAQAKKETSEGSGHGPFLGLGGGGGEMGLSG